MTTQNRVLGLRILRAFPRILLAVCLQGLGVIALTFFTALLFPEQRGLSGLVSIVYLVWSSRRLNRHIARL